MSFPELATVACAICGDTVTIIIEECQTGLVFRPTVLAGCEHFYQPQEDPHE